MRNEAVISRIAHRRVEEAIDHQRSGVLVHLVFDRLAADRNFDDDIHFVWGFLPMEIASMRMTGLVVVRS